MTFTLSDLDDAPNGSGEYQRHPVGTTTDIEGRAVTRSTLDDSAVYRMPTEHPLRHPVEHFEARSPAVENDLAQRAVVAGETSEHAQIQADVVGEDHSQRVTV